MANKENLTPNDARTPSERRKNAQKAGRASGKARRQKRALRECLEVILNSPASDEELEALLKNAGIENTFDNAMSLSLIRKALSGDPKAFEVVRDTIGQKPIDKMQVSTPEPLKIEVDYGDDDG